MDPLVPFRRYFRLAAIGCSLFSAILTGWFGLNQNPYLILALACAGFLVACSLASDYIALFVVDAWRRRSWGMFATCTAGLVLMFSLNLMSNLGSVGWQRDASVTAARVQNVKHDDARDMVSEGKASLEMWSARLAKLEADNAWSGTVTAEAMRAQLASSEKAIELEGARGGCKTKCLALMKSKADLEARIAIAEETSGLRAKIEATKAVLARHRAAAATTPAVVSAPQSQSVFFASLVSLDLAPSEDMQTWTSRGMATWLALGLCIAPMVFGLIGWRSYEGQHIDDLPPTGRVPVASAIPATVQPIEVSVPVHVRADVTRSMDDSHIGTATPPPLPPPAHVVKVRDTKFARRVAQITEQYRQDAGRPLAA